jgi:hypothetical protein
MARRYPYATSPGALMRPADGVSFFEEWDLARDTANRDVLCAEMSRVAYASEEVVRSSLARVGFGLTAWLGGDSLAGRIDTRGAEGFVATRADHSATIVAFRGTEADRPEDLIADSQTLQTEWRPGLTTGRRHGSTPIRAGRLVPLLTEHVADHASDFVYRGSRASHRRA